jgi:copper(I)-binding protein
MNTDEHGYFAGLTTTMKMTHAYVSAFSIRDALYAGKHLCLSVFICGCVVFNVSAEVTVKDAWVRGTVPVQTVTGAFMTVTSSTEAKIVGVKSPIAPMAEIHESTMTDGVNRMHEVQAVPLPAGKPVKLEPGGYHVMLMGLKKPVTQGQKVPLTLEIESGGKRSKVEVQADVRPLGR